MIGRRVIRFLCDEIIGVQGRRPARCPNVFEYDGDGPEWHASRAARAHRWQVRVLLHGRRQDRCPLHRSGSRPARDRAISKSDERIRAG